MSSGDTVAERRTTLSRPMGSGCSNPKRRSAGTSVSFAPADPCWRAVMYRPSADNPSATISADSPVPSSEPSENCCTRDITAALSEAASCSSMIMSAPCTCANCAGRSVSSPRFDGSRKKARTGVDVRVHLHFTTPEDEQLSCAQPSSVQQPAFDAVHGRSASPPSRLRDGGFRLAREVGTGRK
jgi:hypothetical protein